MTRSNIRRILLSFAMLIVASSAASADVVVPYITGFESGDASLGTVSSTNPVGWNFPAIPPGGSIAVVTGSSTDGWGANEQVLHFNGTNASYWGDTVRFDHVVDQMLRVEFKVKLTNSGNNTNPTDFKFLGSDTGGAGYSAGRTTYIRLRGGSGHKFTYFDGGTEQDLMAGVIEGQWYNVIQTLDLANHTFDVTIVNLDNPVQTITLSDLGFTTIGGPAVNNMNFFEISKVGNSGDFQFDDLGISVVPEPASAGLLVLGALMLCGRRR